jgi:hypothetical protein
MKEGMDIIFLKIYFGNRPKVIQSKVKKKSTAVPLHAMEAHGGRGDMTPTLT